jgi:hypothetical protein
LAHVHDGDSNLFLDFAARVAGLARLEWPATRSLFGAMKADGYRFAQVGSLFAQRVAF